jgi:tetratricopeptide (TPR) repeat protein
MAPQPPPGAPADASASQQVLHDSEHLHIGHLQAPVKSRTLVITFDPLMYLWPKAAFGLDFLRRLGVDLVTVQRKAEDFYQSLDRANFEAAVGPRLADYDRVVAYGSSLGAYAALYFCRDLDAEVIAASPRVSVHPVFGTAAWQQQVAWAHERLDASSPAQCRAIIIYDPREATDRRYIEGEVLPAFPRAEVLRVPFAGHPSTQFLGDIGFIAPFVRAVVAGSERPPLDRRRRVGSATYHQVLADLCVRRGRLELAETLIERSLALREANMLAHRTRGMVKTLRREWPDAVAALERALELSPSDPMTMAMLERARRARLEDQAGIAAAPTAGEMSSLARRALRWVTGQG